ncbi:MAG TPA: SWIM zinc finger family protein [Pirellulales bacterium]
MGWYGGYGDWAPYVPVAVRRARAVTAAAKIAKKEKRELCPVKAVGRKLCSSFWGQAWCENLERYSDFSNRLPRGRTYARNGSVVDLQIERGRVKALVSGSELYRISIDIKTLAKPAWKRIKQDCSQSIQSLFDLLQERFDRAVMERLTQPQSGLFPQPTEIEMDCSCPDYAGLCKHLAAVMYCIGARLDAAPELLFLLRDVDHLDLVGEAVAAENLETALAVSDSDSLSTSDLGQMFGIELETSLEPAPEARSEKPRRKRTVKATAKIRVKQAITEVETSGVADGSLAMKRRVVKRRARKSPARTAAVRSTKRKAVESEI